jgi:hypothetical protein
VKNRPIAEAKLRYSVDTGIAIEGMPLLIPEYHVMAAAGEAGYRYYGDWQDLNWHEKANIVALHFARTLIHNHSEDAQAHAAHKANKSASKG